MTELTDVQNSRLRRVGLAGLNPAEEFSFWGANDSDIQSYEKTFGFILGGNHIPELVRLSPQPHLIVDLFSYGYATYKLPGIQTISVALSQSPLPETKMFRHLSGDLEDPYTWLQLNNLIKTVNPQVGKASAVISRQLRGDVATFNTVDSANRMIQRVHSILDYNGFALLQVPRLPPEKYHRWIDTMRESGAKASYQHVNAEEGLEEAVYFQKKFEFEELPLVV